MTACLLAGEGQAGGTGKWAGTSEAPWSTPVTAFSAAPGVSMCHLPARAGFRENELVLSSVKHGPVLPTQCSSCYLAQVAVAAAGTASPGCAGPVPFASRETKV